MKFGRKSLIAIFVLYGTVSMVLSAMIFTERLAYVQPEQWRDISHLAMRRSNLFSDEEYALIFEQTGLGKAAVDSIMPFELKKYQSIFFTEPDYRCEATTPVSFEEYVPEPSAEIVCVEDGDVLVTRSSHILSWRNGHAAIVTDAEKRHTLEAVVIGSNTAFQSLDKWESYPNFKVLRLKGASYETRSSIAATAEKYLADKPYNILAGVLPWKYSPPENTEGTQCAHLVWLAYAAHGYDIDSDGGAIVTPADIAQSSLLETVQTYG